MHASCKHGNVPQGKRGLVFHDAGSRQRKGLIPTTGYEKQGSVGRMEQNRNPHPMRLRIHVIGFPMDPGADRRGVGRTAVCAVTWWE